jgi:hypothetical protein
MSWSRLHRQNSVCEQALEAFKSIHGQFVFGAFAEFIDNAQEAGATKIEISLDEENEILCFSDDGMSIDRASIVRMISLGSSNKEILHHIEDCHMKISNNYGIGFKSGMSRIGQDALILFKSFECSCRPTETKDDNAKLMCFHGHCGGTKQSLRGLAFYSRSLNTQRDGFTTPLIFWRSDGNPLTESSSSLTSTSEILTINENDDNVRAILNDTVCKYPSKFTFKKIQNQFAKITSEYGTRILITGLLKAEDDKQAFGVEDDDICILEGKDKKKFQREDRNKGSFLGDVEIDWSLRAYCELLYRECEMSIYIQSVKISPCNLETRFLEDSIAKYSIEEERLMHDDKSMERKIFRTAVEFTVGFCPMAFNRQLCGLFFYFRKQIGHPIEGVQGKKSCRLILSFDKMASKILQACPDLTSGMLGVVVVDSPLLKPYHGKQRFDETVTKKIEDALNVKIDNCLSEFRRQFMPFSTEYKNRKARLRIGVGTVCWHDRFWKSKEKQRNKKLGRHWPGLILDADDLEHVRKVDAQFPSILEFFLCPHHFEDA